MPGSGNRRRVPLIAGGTVVRTIPEADGVDIEAASGCGLITCPGCQGWKIVVRTKIEPTNCDIRPGDRIFWGNNPHELGWFPMPAGLRGEPRVFARRGKYRRKSATFRGEAVR